MQDSRASGVGKASRAGTKADRKTRIGIIESVGPGVRSWLGATAVALGLGGGIMLVGPLVMMIGVIALLVLLCAVLRPKLFVGAAVLFILFQRTIQAQLDTGIIDYADEVIVVLAVGIFPLSRLIHRSKLRRIPGQTWFLLFAGVGAVSSLVAGVPFVLATQGAFLLLKGAVFGWSVAQINWSREDLRAVVRVCASVAVVLIVGGGINAVVPGAWNRLVVPGTDWGERYGLTPITSLFAHPGYFATTMALVAIGTISYQLCIKSSAVSRFILAGSLIALILTFRRKALIGIVGAGSALWLRFRPIGLIATVVLIVPIVLIVGADAITATVDLTYNEYFINPDAVARIRLTVDAPQVALQHFPLGAGFGRFGSAIARQNYSPEYYALGYPNVWGLGPTAESGKFLTDTFWPAILGEAGFLGFILYAGALFAVARSFFKESRTNQSDKWIRWIALTGFGWTIELAIESLAGPIFSAVPTFALFFFVVGLATAVTAERDESLVARGLTDEFPRSTRLQKRVRSVG
jgi:hypothetical protein